MAEADTARRVVEATERHRQEQAVVVATETEVRLVAEDMAHRRVATADRAGDARRRRQATSTSAVALTVDLRARKIPDTTTQTT